MPYKKETENGVATGSKYSRTVAKVDKLTLVFKLVLSAGALQTIKVISIYVNNAFSGSYTMRRFKETWALAISTNFANLALFQ